VTLAVAGGLGIGFGGCPGAAPICAMSAAEAMASSATEARAASERKEGMRGCDG